jgi:hypothetical protein
MPKKSSKPKSPDKLANTGKKSGVELSEDQLAAAKGGVVNRSLDLK